MTSEYIKSLIEYNQLSKIRFERMYRNIAISSKCEESIDTVYAKELCENGFIEIPKIDLEKLLEVPFSLFEDKESCYLLWLCHCIRYQGKSLLSLINNYINNISKVTRGGINTYKRNGWTVHVLYVYQLVNHNFAYKIIPVAVKWNFNVEPIFESFYREYNELSHTAKFTLKLACFLHDIGVQIAVNDHERLGIPLVRDSYKELKITLNDWKHNHVYFSEEEMIQVLEVIVGNHQLINQVAAEVSDYVIYSKIRQIKNKFSSENTRMFMSTEFSKVMYLLGAADMMAVDDLLLSKTKFEEISEAKLYIQEIIDRDTYVRNYIDFGIKRLKCFVNDDLKNVSDITIMDMIKFNGCSCNDFLKFMYEVQSVSYGVAAIKPLNDLTLTVKFVCVLYKIVSTNTIEYEHVTIKIDAGFEKEYIEELLNFELEDISKMVKYQIIQNENGLEFFINLSK